MAISKEKLKEATERIERAARPLVFYDDDADGLSSWLLLRGANSQAIGVRAARGPELGTDFLRRVEENIPDLIVILDKPRVSKEFMDEVKTPTIWIDHHDPDTQKPHEWTYKNLTYLNPLLGDSQDRRPVSYWCWQMFGGKLWFAGIGTLSDWDESLVEELRKDHAPLLAGQKSIKQILYNSPAGQLVRVFNFSLKGASRQITKNVSALQKIENPSELLEKSTPRGRYVMRHVEPILAEYRGQLDEARKTRTRDGIFVHVFDGLKTSLVAEVANELLTIKDADIIIVGRTSGGFVKFSMRSHSVDLPPLLEKALAGVRGYGGGHTEACGGAIEEDDFEHFLSQLKRARS